ncbi:TonB C-terminal domain-containing protein [Massilia sp. H6]|uniref:TonB C-terminal domain-containing protein n=1 Tax=Massilia sp. H6 TaxID=2970464 RepID=UPI00216A954D|nr:TonB C-terminal domain-containing protein [Massilia sp. H6]UVW28578.1 TonB C-terminal domain-containing protein [Massilia sp. H6]
MDATPTPLPADNLARAVPALGSVAPAPGNTDSAAQKQTDNLARDRALSQARLEQEQRNTELLRQATLAAAQREAARQEQQQLETARAEQAARSEAARLDAERQEQAQHDAIKVEAARQAQAKQEEAQRERAQQESKREERLRAIANQLKQEAAQPTTSSLRRGWLFGRADPNADLVLYAETLRRKIELNMTFDMVRDVVKRPHTQPIVTVAIRADGTVEKVSFVVSSGVTAIDDAIRKVLASQAPYGAFPPGLARQYDVIEIRRTWLFDTAIRLQ